MAVPTSKKVLQVNHIARQAEKTEAVRFEVQQGSVISVALNGISLFEFDNVSDANTWANNLNAALSSVLTNLGTFYENKVKSAIA